MVECDVFCGTCGEKIDHLIAPRPPGGQAEAMLINPSYRAHKDEKGCPDGMCWDMSDWTAVDDGGG